MVRNDLNLKNRNDENLRQVRVDRIACLLDQIERQAAAHLQIVRLVRRSPRSSLRLSFARTERTAEWLPPGRKKAKRMILAQKLINYKSVSN